jgi:hypothetical protein
MAKKRHRRKTSQKLKVKNQKNKAIAVVDRLTNNGGRQPHNFSAHAASRQKPCRKNPRQKNLLRLEEVSSMHMTLCKGIITFQQSKISRQG